MKRLLALVLCLGMLASSLTACGSSGGSAPQTGSSASAALPALPASVKTLPPETEPNEELKKLIISTFAVPEEYINDTYYFYNYADLNGDGTDEIIAAVVGSYVSGEGGDSGLVVFVEDGKMVVNKQLSLVHMPLVVSDETIGGWKMIYAPYFDTTGKGSYHLLRINDEGEKYFNIPDGDTIETLDGVKGTALLYGDARADIAAGTALCLGK